MTPIYPISILKICVSKGQTVQRDDTLAFIRDAEGNEMTLKAQHPGKVTSISITISDVVYKGDTPFAIENSQQYSPSKPNKTQPLSQKDQKNKEEVKGLFSTLLFLALLAGIVYGAYTLYTTFIKEDPTPIVSQKTPSTPDTWGEDNLYDSAFSFSNRWAETRSLYIGLSDEEISQGVTEYFITGKGSDNSIDIVRLQPNRTTLERWEYYEDDWTGDTWFSISETFQPDTYHWLGIEQDENGDGTILGYVSDLGNIDVYKKGTHYTINTGTRLSRNVRKRTIDGTTFIVGRDDIDYAHALYWPTTTLIENPETGTSFPTPLTKARGVDPLKGGPVPVIGVTGTSEGKGWFEIVDANGVNERVDITPPDGQTLTLKSIIADGSGYIVTGTRQGRGPDNIYVGRWEKVEGQWQETWDEYFVADFGMYMNAANDFTQGNGPLYPVAIESVDDTHFALLYTYKQKEDEQDTPTGVALIRRDGTQNNKANLSTGDDDTVFTIKGWTPITGGLMLYGSRVTTYYGLGASNPGQEKEGTGRAQVYIITP